MPELLLELLSEEIPARMQARAAADLKALVTGGLVESGLTYEGAQSHAGPRRLVLSVEGLAGRSPETTEDRKGPRVDAPRQAIEGFLRSAGVRLEDCKQVEDKKGRFLVARITRPGRATPEIVAELVPDIIRRFPWPKSMRWGSGTLRWVRPLHSILCTFDGETVPLSIEGIVSGNLTRGHRFMAPAEFAVRRFEDYAARLAQAFVMVDAAERAETIRTEANNLAFAQGFEVVEDEALIAETAGLAEWPVVLMGSFDEAFLDLPPEVISTSIKHHQKCFSLRRRPSFETRPSGAPQDEARNSAPHPDEAHSSAPHPEEARNSVPHPEEARSAVSKDATTLANRYLLVANLIAKDGGKEIVAGNNRVIAARLSDARFFWDQDRKTKLEDLLPKLEGIIFHGKLGSQRQRVERLEHLAGEIAGAIGADVDQARLAARLCKTDLVTGMVGEFPELQGLMGYYYALAEGHAPPQVAEAIRDHYKPQGPSDTVPASRVAQAVALADKLDLLVGFWAIGEKPTGSKDPFALRRAALGIIRSLLENGLRLSLGDRLGRCFKQRLAIGAGYIIWRRITEVPSRAVDDEISTLINEFPFEAAYLNHDGLLSSFVGVLIGALEDVKQPGQEFDLYALRNSPALRSNVELLWEDGNPYGWKVSSASEALNSANRLVDRILGLAELALATSDLHNISASPRKRQPGEVEDIEIARFARETANDLLAFFADRLRVHLREQGARHDLIDAVFSIGGQDDLLMIVRRVEALGRFLDTEDGEHLLAGVKRAINIVRIEEKRDSASYDAPPDRNLLVQGEEKALASAIDRAEAQAKMAVEAEDFEAAMRAIAKLRGPIDVFFDHVTVNADDPSFRENRLKLLNRIRAATLAVADFSRIEG